MTGWLIALLLASAAPATTLPGTQQVEADSSTIVVTGRRLGDTERALRECVTRKCPPLEDITATLAHAENQFLTGSYEDARRTLRRSLGRNRDAAKAHPIAVSMLYRADSRIALHMGEDEDYRTSATGVVKALKAGLADDSPQVLIGRFDLAQMYANIGQYHMAINAYDGISADAGRTGAVYLQGQADLRRAALTHAFNKRSHEGRTRLEALARNPHPELRMVRLGARILLARIDRENGGPGASDALIAELMAGGFRRTLLHAPPMQPLPTADRSGIGDPWRSSTAETHRETWVDVGFQVRGDGRTEDVEILRGAGPTDWTGPVLSSIAGRIYTPAESGEGTYRVERFSFTSAKIDVTGTRFRRHSDEWRIEQIDVTAR